MMKWSNHHSKNRADLRVTPIRMSKDAESKDVEGQGERYTYNYKVNKMNLQDKIINALYAQAVADSVGNPFEFKTNINPDDVVAYANSAKTLVISDDTQMAIAGFDAIRQLEMYDGDIVDQITHSFTESYLDWYYTQTHAPMTHLAFKSGILQFKSLYSVQSPGNTCMFALKTLQSNSPVRNDSKGCGSVMRLLPLLSLRNRFSHDDCVKFAQISGAITHKHKDNDLAIEYYMTVAEAVGHGLAFESEYIAKHISYIGEGWTALEAVEMAIWAYCTAKDFDDLLRLSIAHDGDSDSVAAIAGSLWGLSGKEVPRKYIEKLDALDALVYICANI